MQSRQPGTKREERGIIRIAAGCGDAHVSMDANEWAARKPYDDNGSRSPVAREERPRMSLADLASKAQDLVDKAQAVIDRKGIDEALASEICMVRINEYGRLDGMQVRKCGKEMNAVAALAECLDRMTVYMAGLPPW